MGLDNREYLRDESRRYGEGGGGFSGGGMGFGSNSPMTKRLLLITIGVFVAQLLFTQPPDPDQLAVERMTGQAQRVSYVDQWCALDTSKVLKGQVWRLLTYGFCHSRDLMHILFNMLIFYFFGKVLESIYGSMEFLAFYLTGIVVAGVAFIGLDLLIGEQGIAIGASGGVMAVMVLYAIHFPKQIVYAFLVIPIQIRYLVAILAAIDLFPVLQMLNGRGDLNTSVAHAAHLGGLAFGFFYGRQRWRLFPFFSSLSTKWKVKRSGLKIVTDDPPEQAETSRLAQQMDVLLQKISEHGEQSLTAKERRTLEKVSRELRNRRD